MHYFANEAITITSQCPVSRVTGKVQSQYFKFPISAALIRTYLGPGLLISFVRGAQAHNEHRVKDPNRNCAHCAFCFSSSAAVIPSTIVNAQRHLSGFRVYQDLRLFGER
jgi:hypothetical protein